VKRAIARVVACLLLGVCSLFSEPAGAAEPSLLRGLPALDVAALAASPTRLFVGGFDAGLYVVEQNGQARHLSDAALSPNINALLWSERAQRLWLGTARGLTRCQLTPAFSCTRLGPSSAVHALLLRSDGTLAAGGDAGLSFVQGDSVQTFGKKQRAPFRSVWALAESSDGTLFVGTTNGLFWGKAASFAAGHGLSRASIVSGDLPDDWVTALLFTGDRLHVGTYNAGVASFGFDAQKLQNPVLDESLGYVNPAGLSAFGDGVAIATMEGLYAGTATHTAVVHTQARDITAVVAAAGGYWIGTRHGLEWSRSLGSEAPSPR
jgi:ligand-binding sensor domain-containing protein